MHQRMSYIERTVEDLRYQDEQIHNDIIKIKREIVDKTPEKFSKNDLLRSFLGSLILGFSVIFSSNLVNVSKILPLQHIFVIALFTFTVLSSEIYFIGYARVENKHERKFGQFWFKRILAFYFVAFTISLILVYVFGVIYLVETQQQFLNLMFLISTPCAIGASISDLLKKY
jgi:uncharacterized membrane protein